MPFPKPVPSLNKEESVYFRERLAEFEVSPEMQEDLEKMRELQRKE